ncbi:MAG: hypothetical protein ABGX47_07175 [Martelella sp.]|uniref:hypothetical protein n=1 Tax=Martelella sp. TaxID=1969699 RepID=UPI0032421BB5
MKRMLSIVCALAVASPAFAATTWSSGISRGLTTYSVSTDGGKVQLVCDPDKVFGDVSNASLKVDFGKPISSSQIVVLSERGEQAPFTFDDSGFVLQADANPESWDLMVGIIRTGGSYAFVTSQAALQLDGIAPIPDLDC